MTTSSSSVPVLGPVLYFTSTDGYSYDVDNRPIFHLDTNIRHINTSLVGIGYGEHASLAGGLLTPGKAVLLASNGSVFYPTGAPSTNPTENIVGLVIGATDTGLNRVIWSSKHLDLDVLGLSSLSARQASGAYLITTAGALGALSTTSTPNLTTQYVVGRIKAGPYVEINTSTDLIASNVATTVGNAVEDNHANMYGFSKLRNLLLYMDIGEAPIQFSKSTIRMSAYPGGVRNPMNATLSGGSLVVAGLTDSTAYGTSLDSFVLKERYSQFINNSANPEQVSCGADLSTWAPTVYGTTLLPNGSENYELQPLGTYGLDYSTPSNIPLFKAFTIDKYYQYSKVSPSSNLFGKIQVTATVFNPDPASDPNFGGESAKIIVMDFYSYDSSTALETNKTRIILNGQAAMNALLPSANIFPATLITL